MAANIGMMDGAYFVGRGEILSWINNTLALNLQKVEEVRRLHWQRIAFQLDHNSLTEFLYDFMNARIAATPV
jgi:hypothetical protein